MLRHLPLLVALLLLGCDDDETVAVDPPAAPSGPSVPTLEEAWTDAPPAGTPLVVAVDAIRIGDGDPIVALENRALRAEDKQGGANGFMITALFEHLQQRPAPGTASALAFADDIPFRTFADVVYTMGQSERADLVLLVRVGGELRGLPIHLPEPDEMALLGALGGRALEDVLAGALGEDPGESSPPAEPPPAEETPSISTFPIPMDESALTLSLMITLVPDGVVVSGAGGKLEPGCETTAIGRVITVPREENHVDVAALRRCLLLVHAQFQDEDSATIAADPEIPFRDVVQAIATARGTRAEPLFPRVAIAAGVR